jgi:hypothetical protein
MEVEQGEPVPQFHEDEESEDSRRTDESGSASSKSSKLPAHFNRHSTFDRFPQYIFPSLYNAECDRLDQRHDIPYAFSHHHAAFFWTQEDALNGLYWNIFARPPCLNCICEGERRATQCNRGARQFESMGRKRCCTYCEEMGASEDSCIEMIEVRINPISTLAISLDEDDKRAKKPPKSPSMLEKEYDDPTPSKGRYGDHGLDKHIWTEFEELLRSQGKVYWTPINLHLIRPVIKDRLLQIYGDGKTAPMTFPRAKNGYRLSNDEFIDDDAKLWRMHRDMMFDKIAMWQKEEGKLDLQQQARDEREMKRWYMLTESSQSKPKKTATTDTMGGVHSFDAAIQDSFERAKVQLLQARQAQYAEEIINLPAKEAEVREETWRNQYVWIFEVLKRYLTGRLERLERGASEDEACWEGWREVEAGDGKLGGMARGWIDDLKPELLMVGELGDLPWPMSCRGSRSGLRRSTYRTAYEHKSTEQFLDG